MWVGQGLGSGQAWQNLLGNSAGCSAPRSSGVTCINAGAKPIEISVRVVAGTMCLVFASINGGPYLNIGISSVPSGTSYCIGSMVVPSGATYVVSAGGFGSPAIDLWQELR
jgi:hypothetical protein